MEYQDTTDGTPAQRKEFKKASSYAGYIYSYRMGQHTLRVWGSKVKFTFSYFSSAQSYVQYSMMHNS